MLPISSWGWGPWGWAQWGCGPVARQVSQIYEVRLNKQNKHISEAELWIFWSALKLFYVKFAAGWSYCLLEFHCLFFFLRITEMRKFTNETWNLLSYQSDRNGNHVSVQRLCHSFCFMYVYIKDNWGGELSVVHEVWYCLMALSSLPFSHDSVIL